MKIIKQYLNKVFGLSKSKKKISLDLVSHFLVKCAKSHSYIETLGKHADSIHNWIKSSYEEDFKKHYELQVRKIISRLGIMRARIAIDITHECFYGKTTNLYTIGVDKNLKHKSEFRYITCCLINQGKEIPLMALPVPYGASTKLTIDLLKFCSSLFSKIGIVLFDRGFYVAEIIDFLEAKKINYLMLVPNRKGIIREHIDKTDDFALYNHEMSYSKDKSKWKPKTNLAICKNFQGHDWIFATNLNFANKESCIYTYKKRWQIETNYRVEDEAKIKSKSANYLIRYFYFMISSLLHLLWIFHKNVCYYVQFKKYLDIIEHEILFEFLGIKGI
jgi:hypothetical protein